MISSRGFCTHPAGEQERRSLLDKIPGTRPRYAHATSLASKHRSEKRGADTNKYDEIIKILIDAGADPVAVGTGGTGVMPPGRGKYPALSVFPATNLIGYPYWNVTAVSRGGFPDLRLPARG